MYTPPAFRKTEPAWAHAFIRASRMCTLVTATSEGLAATPLPVLLDAPEQGDAFLTGHLARANRQWQLPATGDALAIFTGPDAYVTPSWYPSKQRDGKVVPTWNYQAVHVYGDVSFFEDAEQLRAVVTRLTNLHEAERAGPWQVTDAPPAFVDAQLRGIVGVWLRITRIEAKSKMSQNRSIADQDGVAAGLGASDRVMDRAVAALVAGERAPGEKRAPREGAGPAPDPGSGRPGSGRPDSGEKP